MAAILMLVVAALLGVPLLLFLAQDRLIFYPRPSTPAERALIAERAADVRSVFLHATDGTRVHAWHVDAGEGAPLIVYFGGNAEQVSWMIDEVRGRLPGVSFLLSEYRGYGASEGAPSERALAADAVLWFDHAASAHRAERIYVLGRSLGSALAVRVAASRTVAGVIAIAPFDSLEAVAQHYYPFLPVRWLLRHRFDAAALAPRASAPLLCVVAQADEIIPIERSRRLYDAWGGPKTWIELEGAGHNSTDASPLFWESLRAFVTAG